MNFIKIDKQSYYLKKDDIIEPKLIKNINLRNQVIVLILTLVFTALNLYSLNKISNKKKEINKKISQRKVLNRVINRLKERERVNTKVSKLKKVTSMFKSFNLIALSILLVITIINILIQLKKNSILKKWKIMDCMILERNWDRKLAKIRYIINEQPYFYEVTLNNSHKKTWLTIFVNPKNHDEFKLLNYFRGIEIGVKSG